MIPHNVTIIMEKLGNELQKRLGNKLTAIYLYGSTVLNAYIPGTSDIDFIVLVREPLSTTDLQEIREAHKEVERQFPGADIMGAYLLSEDLGKVSNQIAPYPTYYNKQFHPDSQGADINPVTWWILRSHGVCIFGQEVPLTYVTQAEELVRYTAANMSSYWVGWIGKLEERLSSVKRTGQAIDATELDDAVEWCVLGMLRQYYTIREEDVTSKLGAADYGFKMLPERWHGLIREAAAIKRKEPQRVYASPIRRLEDLLEVLRWIHKESIEVFSTRWS